MEKRSEGDSETPVKTLDRGDLIEAGARVLDLALQRMEGRYTKNTERIKWARIIAGTISATAGVLKDADLDDLAMRVSALEERETGERE